MLINIVGKTGSGKSLYNAYKAYDELTRIMNNGIYYPWYKFWKRKYSYYDYVVMNSNFNDSRGNFTLFVKAGNTCNCKKQYRNIKDTSTVNVDLLRKILNDDSINEDKKYSLFHDLIKKTSTLTEKIWDQNSYGNQFALVDHWEYGGKCIGISDLPEVYDMRNCLLLLDEGGTQFSNRDWADMPVGYLLFLTTHRHNVTHLPKRFDIYLYTQQADLVDITLRRLANHIYLIRPLFGYSSDPTRPYWFQKIPAIFMWSYWKHEILQSNPIMGVDTNGVPIPIPKNMQVERLDYFNWYWFPSMFFKKNKYIACYNTLDEVRELKRLKGV